MIQDLNQRGYRRCVGMAILRHDGRFLTATRRDASARYAQMPQGGVDEPESLEEAAVREIEEELGLTPDSFDILCASNHLHRYDLPPELRDQLWGGRFRGQEQRWFLIYFHGQPQDIRLDGHDNAPAEFSSVSWRWPQEVVSAAVPFKQAIYQAIMNEFAAPAREHIAKIRANDPAMTQQ